MARDEVKDSFYLRAMRTSIGAALRQQYAVDEPLPERLTKLLKKLEETQARPKASSENATSGAEPAAKSSRRGALD